MPKSRAFVTDGGELLNSFFVTDLATCADAVEQGDCGAALRLYLRGPDSAEGRVDVVKQPEVVDEGVAPQLTRPPLASPRGPVVVAEPAVRC